MRLLELLERDANGCHVRVYSSLGEKGDPEPLENDLMTVRTSRNGVQSVAVRLFQELRLQVLRS